MILDGFTGILKFQAEWCAPCKRMAPVVEEVASELELEVKEVDIDEEYEMASQFSIRSVPSLFLLKDGQVVAGPVGSQTKDKFFEFASQLKS